MKARFFFIAAAFAALTVSCAKEFATEQQSSDVSPAGPRITASFDNNAGPVSKNVFVDPANGNYNMKWELGDIIKVSNRWCGTEDDVTVKYQVAAINDGVATFELVEGEDLSRFSADSTIYYAMVGQHTAKAGYVSNTSGNMGLMKSVINTTSELTAGNIGKDTQVAIARATIGADGSLNFNFKNVLCYIKVTMPADSKYTNLRIATGFSGASVPTGFACIGWDEDGNPTTFKRTSGGSGNAAYKPAEGTFKPCETYYLPIWPERDLSGKKLQGSEDGTNYTDLATCNFTTVRGKIINIGAIPDATPVTLPSGAKLLVAGEGVAEIDRDHHMTWLTNPAFDYKTDRISSAFYGDFAWDKMDGNNVGTHYNNWLCTAFDYEIFVKLLAGKPVYFVTDGASPVYAQLKGGYSWKDTTPSAAPLELGKTGVAFSSVLPLGFTVPEDGVYRIRFNATTKEAYILKLGKAQFDIIVRFWPTKPGVTNNDIEISGRDGSGEYLGHGVWTKTIDTSTDIAVNSSNGKGGYKFLFGGLDDDQPYGREYGVETPYVAFNPANVDNYWKIVPVQGGIWGGALDSPKNGTWQLADPFYNQKIKITLYMNDTYGAYAHSIAIAE